MNTSNITELAEFFPAGFAKRAPQVIVARLRGETQAQANARSAAFSKWQHDRETGEHFLPVDEESSWKVYKTAGGDYALTLHDEQAGCGDEVEYFDTLRKAKAEAERRWSAAA